MSKLMEWRIKHKWSSFLIRSTPQYHEQQASRRLEHDFWTQAKADEAPALGWIIPHMATLNHSYFNSGVYKLLIPSSPIIVTSVTSRLKSPFRKKEKKCWFIPSYTQMGKFHCRWRDSNREVKSLTGSHFYTLSQSAIVTSSQWSCSGNKLSLI